MGSSLFLEHIRYAQNLKIASGIKQTVAIYRAIKEPRQGNLRDCSPRTSSPDGRSRTCRLPCLPIPQVRVHDQAISGWERFDPETTRLLGIAFEFAIQALHTWVYLIRPARQ